VAILQLTALDGDLDRLANSPDEPPALRREALRAIVPRRRTLRPATFELLLNDIASDADPLLRLSAAEAFGNARLDRQQLAALLPTIQGDALISPAVLLPMLERSTTSETAPLVVEFLEHSLRAGWHPPRESLAGLLGDLSEPMRERVESALNSNLATTEELHARMAKLLPLLENGNAKRGRAVFFASKAACSTCHRAGSEGGQVGPDLTGIGAIRAGRDLLESIVVPSSTIAQEFDQYTAITSDGRVTSGILTQQTADTIALRDSSGALTRIRRDQIDELNRQPTSLMPDGLDRLLSPQELSDLIAFLQSQK
jgi:putative heme-binding domain-containing protein